MKQVFIQKGKAIVGEVPVPLVSDDELLVQVYYSCVSIGTEIFKVEASGRPLYKKIIDQPQNIGKVLKRLKDHGIRDAILKVKSKVEGKNPIGYSASGIVLEAGKNIKNFNPGDRVACAGDRIANHAEFIAVPENLTVKIPDGLSFKEASTVALGSIALQGIRRTNPSLGETVVIYGLGGIGQLASQICRSAGCRVIGIDIDKLRIEKASSLGMDISLNPSDVNVVDEVIKHTGGYGADAVVITAASDSREIINNSMAMCRKKGRVVIIGNVNLNLEREKFYEKELDILISTSYGPGRYDERYEMKAFDYPLPYVRWTENRNMKEYLNLLSEKRVDISSFMDCVFKVEEASSAYELLESSQEPPLIVLLEYNKDSKPATKIIIGKTVSLKHKINMAIIGAGSFVKDMHLPNLDKLNDIYRIYAVCNKCGNNAIDIGEQYGASYVTTDYRKVIEDKEVDMVMIATRHNLHAKIIMEALKEGKAVFVEKPLAINETELEKIIKVLNKNNLPIMVDYNRRFSPIAIKIKEITDKRINPMIINYRMNAGYIPPESWVHSREEGGGRNIGEACHIYDLFNYFTDCEPLSIKAEGISPKTENVLSNDNFSAVVKFSDGSVCNLIYTSQGSELVSKEQMEIYFDNKIIYMDDYLFLKIYGQPEQDMKLKKRDKGHFGALKAFGDSLLNNKAMPIPIEQLIQASAISFEVEKQIKTAID
jgi:predicted dehydrogenase/threonine dehydrogenase-like Zn-dependent dehydrogenase